MTDAAKPDPLDALAQRIPEISAFDADPEIQDLMTRAFGAPDQYWDPSDRADLTTKLLVCAVRARVRQLEQAFERLETQARVAQAAQERWRALLLSGANVTFTNDAGDLASIPASIVQLIQAHKPIDAALEDRGQDVLFSQGKRVVARVPKTLLVSLPRLLERGLWESPKSRSDKSQSHPSRGNPTSSRPSAEPKEVPGG